MAQVHSDYVRALLGVHALSGDVFTTSELATRGGVRDAVRIMRGWVRQQMVKRVSATGARPVAYDATPKLRRLAHAAYETYGT